VTPDDPRHGTNAGYIAHFLDGEKTEPCLPCRGAHARYAKQLRNKRYVNRADRLRTSATPTRRRLQALAAIGWPWAELNERLGYGPRTQRISGLLVAEHVHVDMERRVAALYEELHMTKGPSSMTRQRAVKKGWAPPMAWDNIGDPWCRPKGVRAA
jgi:hypothetical protein